MFSYCYSVSQMVAESMNVVFAFPTKEQGRSVFWENVENDGFKTIDHLPEHFIARKDNHNMRIVLKNGSTFQVLGTTDPDALRGANGRIYILDEFVDQDSSALDVIRPIVAVNGGQIIAQSTPKIDGPSGATFQAMYERARITPGQYASLVTADKYIDKETLEGIRQEYIAKHGNDFFFRQEFFCDFGAASSTSYYAEFMNSIEEKKHIGEHPYNSAHPVYTAWDLGMSDSTAIAFFQVINNRIYLIDHFETNSIGLNSIVPFVMSKPYNFGWHFFPHDASVRSLNDAVSRIDTARSLGLINSVLLTREAKDLGINRMVMMKDKIFFNESTTEMMRRKLLVYKRKFNPLTGNYIGPDHKTESNTADSFRYVGTAYNQYFDKRTGAVLIGEIGSSSGSYERESLSMPSLMVNI